MKTHLYSTPSGVINGWIKEKYRGLRGQLRICLVDQHGRVHHFDLDELGSGIPKPQVRMLKESE